MVDTSKCPCGSANAYDDCCKPYHFGLEIPATAEILMRSRYAAYVKKLKQYLLDTWHPSQKISAENFDFEQGLRWLGLKVIGTKAGLETDTEGEVEFIASYSYNKIPAQLKERSCFLKESGRWYYVKALN